MNSKIFVSFIGLAIISIVSISGSVVGSASADSSTSISNKDEFYLAVEDIKYTNPPELEASEDVEIKQRDVIDESNTVTEVEDQVYDDGESTVYPECDTYYYDYDEDEIEYYNSGGLTASSGVNYYNGRKETYYSSNVLHHYRTSEWTAGDDGVYRDGDGYVVIAANVNEYSEGDIIDTSFGPAKVYDSGCDYGTTDIYVNW